MQLRSRLATVAITTALTAGMLTGLGVAVPASAAVARTQVKPAVDPAFFESAGTNEYITGDTHGSNLFLGAGNAYNMYSKGGSTYALAAGGYCWNAYPASGRPVGEDSCPPNDTNEWFTLYPGEGTQDYTIQQYSSGLWVSAIGSGIYLEPSGVGNQVWIKLAG
jgi:hypothetical protein